MVVVQSWHLLLMHWIEQTVLAEVGSLDSRILLVVTGRQQAAGRVLLAAVLSLACWTVPERRVELSTHAWSGVREETRPWGSKMDLPS